MVPSSSASGVPLSIRSAWRRSRSAAASLAAEPAIGGPSTSDGGAGGRGRGTGGASRIIASACANASNTGLTVDDVPFRRRAARFLRIEQLGELGEQLLSEQVGRAIVIGATVLAFLGVPDFV